MQISNSSHLAAHAAKSKTVAGQTRMNASDDAPSDTSSATLGPTLTASTALFLDFDGTLVDLAAQPDLVVVPKGLIRLLEQLSHQFNGALAIVSGRSLADLDAYLAPLKLPSAAEHGAVQRLAGGQPTAAASAPLHDIVRVASALAAQHAGLRVEIKSHALALHYRHAPELESFCLEAMAEAVKRTPGLELLRGKFVLDIKPAGITKGTAIQQLMDTAPFKGRIPLFAGDDTTDEAGFSVVQSLGGETIKVGTGNSLARYRSPDPLTFRQWLQDSSKKLKGFQV
jgi:trehalose 6-phosphate phosphatase